MAIDPFAQQVIQYDYCSTTVPDIAAFITRTNNYTAGQRASNGGIGHSSNAMNAAFFGEGLYDPPAQASSNIRINCPAGNCTFPVSAEGVSYMSLGMCSSCEDISSTITNRTGQVADGEGKTITQVIDYVLPSNLSIPLEEHVVAATLVVTPPETLVEGMVNQSITTFEMLMTETTGCKDDLTLQGCRVWASRCSLTPCVKSYSANITNNVLHERELSSFPLQILPAAGGAAYFGIFADSSTVNGVVSDCNPTDQPTERNTLRMAEGTTWISQEYLKNVSSAPYYPPDCAFTMETASTDGLTTSLFGTYGNQNISKIFDDYNGNPWMLQLFNNGTGTPESLKTAIGGLANVITAAMRNGGDEVNSAPAAGTVILSQTCIRVHWAWLALPASLLILSSTFLACTMIQTSADSIGMAWKSSPLALLFHGFNYQTVQSVGDVNRSSEMEATARKMRARLTWEEHGWKFSKVATEKTASAGCDQAPATRNDATAQEDAALYFAPPPRYGTKR